MSRVASHFIIPLALTIPPQQPCSNLWSTVQNVFDVKPPTFRIVFIIPGNTQFPNGRMVAAAETLKEINTAWMWIEEHILPEMRGLEDIKDKESFVISKFMSLVSSTLYPSSNLKSKANLYFLTFLMYIIRFGYGRKIYRLKI